MIINKSFKAICCFSFLAGLMHSSLTHAAAPEYYKNILSDENSDWIVSTTFETRSENYWPAKSTTYQITHREQTVDLLKHNVTADILGRKPPIIAMESFYSAYCNDKFNINIEFLDAQKRVVGSWNKESSNLDLQGCHSSNDDASAVGNNYQIRNEIQDYDNNVRYIRWKESYESLQDSQGKFRAVLKMPYLGVASPNLLKDPNDLMSWDISGSDKASIKSSETASGEYYLQMFGPKFNGIEKRQDIDLLSSGYTPEQLDSGNYPLFIYSSFSGSMCNLNYHLIVTLYDKDRKVLKKITPYSEMQGEPCEYGSNQSDSNNNRSEFKTYIKDYPKGVRYISWVDGGVITDHGAPTFFGSYMTLMSESNNSRVKRDLNSFFHNYWPTIGTGILAYGTAALTCVGTLGTACAPSMILATSVTVSTAAANTWAVAPQQKPADEPAPNAPTIPTDCDDKCTLDRISSSLQPFLKDKLWSVDYNNEIKILSNPSKGETALGNMGDDFKYEVARTISGGTKFIDITTLANIEGDEWINTLATALSSLEDNLRLIHTRRSNNDSKAVVRVYVGMPGLLTGMPDYMRDIWSRRISASGGQLGVPENQWDAHFESLLRKLTSKLTGGTDLTVYVSGGRTALDFNWNHSKIIAVDGTKAIVGGHNLWSEYFDKEEPVFDTSVSISGNSAVAAHRYVDQLWRNHALSFTPQGNTHIVKWNKNIIESRVANVEMSTDYISPSEHSNMPYQVLSVGSVGNIQTESQIKRAILTMVDHAEHNIYFSQQSLVHPIINQSAIVDAVDTDLLSKIADKATKGVDIKIIVSNENAPHDTKSNASNRDMLRAIWTAGVKKGSVPNSTESITKFCRNIKLGNLRIDDSQDTYPGKTDSFANHSKTVMVDKKVFLIGSHNVYGQTPMQLSEFAYVIANNKMAQDYDSEYWQPLIEHSTRTFMSTQDCEKEIKLVKDEL